MIKKNNWLLILSVAVFGLVSLAAIGFLVQRGVQKPQTAAPSQAVETDPTRCQGNFNAPAKCFDCIKETSTTSSQINIADFSQCFVKFYGKNVGKP